MLLILLLSIVFILIPNISINAVDDDIVPTEIALPYEFTDLEIRNYEINLPNWNIMKWSNDGDYLAIVAPRGDVYILDKNYEFSKMIEYPVETNKLILNVGIQWMRNSHELIIRYMTEGRIEFWDIDKEKRLYYFELFFPYDIELSHDGDILAINYIISTSHLFLFNVKNQTTVDTMDYNLLIQQLAWKNNPNDIMLINHFDNFFNFDLEERRFNYVEDNLNYLDLNSNPKLEYIILLGENFVKIASTIDYKIYLNIKSNNTDLGRSGIDYQLSPHYYRSWSSSWKENGEQAAISLNYHRLGYGFVSIWNVPEMSLAYNISTQPLYKIDWENSKGLLAGINGKFLYIWEFKNLYSSLTSHPIIFIISIAVIIISIVILRKIKIRNNISSV